MEQINEILNTQKSWFINSNSNNNNNNRWYNNNYMIYKIKQFY